MQTFIRPLAQILTWACFFVLSLLPPSAHAQEFLEPEQAFKLHASTRASTLVMRFEISRGYYMYREQFRVTLGEAALPGLSLPKGKEKYDETFQKTVETYRDQLEAEIALPASSVGQLLTITGQGCADKGLCYPPMNSRFKVTVDGLQPVPNDDGSSAFGVASPGASVAAQKKEAKAIPSDGSGLAPPDQASQSDEGRINAVLKSGNFWAVVAVFFVAGLLLSFTPCVLPMLPILSSIIVGGGGKPSRLKGFLLALSYSLGMALVYTSLGVAAGLAGEGLAASLQKPWVLGTFALLLVGFSLSMFGVYELQLPHRFTGGVNDATQKLPSGRVFSVFVMGGLSALIVSPCVAAPLAGALLYISQSKDVVLGGGALFSMAAGMSVPLLLLGLSAGTLLPKAGPWMDGVKHFFGMLLLGVALYTVQPVLPKSLVQGLWGALLIATAAMLGFFDAVTHHVGRPRTWLRKTASLAALVFGLAQLLGAAAGGSDPLAPLALFAQAKGSASGEGKDASALPFQKVSSVQELEQALAQAKSAGQPVMLDFYADWCVSCKEMERFTFSDAVVQQRLGKAMLLKADVTANNANDRELLKRFKLFGPPGIIFFDPQGQELTDARVVGYQPVARFLVSLNAAGI